MKNRSRKVAVALASTGVSLLAVGGVAAAWGLPGPSYPRDGFLPRPTFSGTVASVGAGSFTLTEAGGTTVTVDVTSSTTYAETGTANSLTGVIAGERVLVTPTPGTGSTATTVTATHVLVVLAEVSGTVQSVGSGSFTVLTPGDLVLTANTTPSTTYTENGATATGVTVGQPVTAFGTPDPSAPSQLDAQFVDVRPAPTTTGARPWPPRPIASFPWSPGPGTTPAWAPPRGPAAPGTTVTGKVQSVTGDDIVVTGSSGSTTTVVVSPSTRYLGTAGEDSLAAVTDGETITVFGTSADHGDVDASVVLIGALPPVPRPGAPDSGPYRPGGFRPGIGETGGSTPPPTTAWTTPSNHQVGPGPVGTPGPPTAASPGWSGHPITEDVPTAPPVTVSAGLQQGPGGRGPQGSPDGSRSGGRGPSNVPGNRG
ncbi:MAG: DUF5666 domain-containing protein [Acidimicrobiales bacterium]|jgi:hypothetical protein